MKKLHDSHIYTGGMIADHNGPAGTQSAAIEKGNGISRRDFVADYYNQRKE